MMPMDAALEDSPPPRMPEPVLHLSAGRHLYAQRYVIGWAEHGLVKVGCGNQRRVKRFTATRGAELIDLAYYEQLWDDVRSECWLAKRVGQLWPQAWQNKEQARFLMGNNTGGYTEFYAIPVEDWPQLRALAAV